MVWLWLGSWLMASCDLVGSLCSDSWFIAVQVQSTISRGGEGWEVLSVQVSLNLHQRERTVPCLSVWVWRNGCMSSSSSHISLCLLWWRGEEVNTVTVTVSGFVAVSDPLYRSCRVSWCDWRCAVMLSWTSKRLQLHLHSSGTLEKAAWTGSTLLSSWFLTLAKLMFIHYSTILSPAGTDFCGKATLMMIQKSQRGSVGH